MPHDIVWVDRADLNDLESMRTDHRDLMNAARELLAALSQVKEANARYAEASARLRDVVELLSADR